MTSYTELSQDPVRFLALTGYTVEEFQALLPSFQARFEQYVQTHTVEGKLRQKRLYTNYRHSPLSTIEDKLLFILIDLKQNATPPRARCDARARPCHSTADDTDACAHPSCRWRAQTASIRVR
jgi:hypothetical protein